MKCTMTAKAKVNPTEELNKVIMAVSNIFNYDELEIEEGYIIVTGGEDSLKDMRESLKTREIRDTAERMLQKGLQGNTIKFALSKQTALVSIPNFVDRKMSALGEIDVTIETNDIEGFIYWMTGKSS